ncbi:MAG: hypothetical protein IT306_09805 [Chloroflexi bacterium]|nr:hypothetical protein [Chloroflexota bacterium]
MSTSTWAPPAEVTREAIVAASDRILARPDLPLEVREDIFRIRVHELDWDIGGKVYQPKDESAIPTGPDGKKIGAFLLHGGGGDHRGMEPLALLLARKLGWKIATLSHPGHLYLHDDGRDWPGDTINGDGTARTPIWCTDEVITPDQYRIVEDRSDPVFRAKYGTLIFLEAKEGTPFYDRMGSWPAAFEQAMIAVCKRNFPAETFSIYAHGHSTGGPFVHMLLQRVENIAGLIGIESTPFGRIMSAMLKQTWPYPFNWITVRTWRDIARYAGPEAGADGMKRLPWLMEDVLAAWELRKPAPNIKAEHVVQFAAYDVLEAGARSAARRLKLNAEETEALVAHYRDYPRELSGPGVKPVPPLLYGITSGSRDHTRARYEGILLPELAKIDPAPKARVVQFMAGVHGYMKPEQDLPSGIGPAIISLWQEAIDAGYYLA